MKQLKSILWMLLTPFLFAFCDSKEATDMNLDREEVNLVTNVSMSEGGEAFTRAAELGFSTGTSMKLVVRDNNNPAYFTQKDLTATANAPSGSSNSLTVSSKLYWDDLGGKNANLKLIGIYPITTVLSADDRIDHSVTTNQSAGVETYDVMCALNDSYAYAGKSYPAELKYKHILTKVTITLTSSDYTVAELNSAVLTYNVSTQAKYNVLTKTFTDYNAVSSLTPYKTEYKRIESGSEVLKGYSFTALMPPFAAGNNLARITLNGNTYTVNATPRTLESGVHTNYNVTVSKSGVLMSASIVDWATPTGEAVDSRLVELGEFAVGDGSSATKVTDGSKVFMKIKDNNGIFHNAEYVCQNVGGTNKWIATVPVYWDDIISPLQEIKGLLEINANPVTGEHYLVGEKTGSFAMQSTIDLGATFFTHPLSKITIKVKTTTGSDKVNIKGITAVVIPGCGTFSVDLNELILLKDGSADQSITGIYDTSTDTYTCTGYIYPQALSGSLCKITVQENVSSTNVYDVKFNTSPNTFEAGTHYSYEVTLTKTGLSITGGIKEWTTGTGGDIGTGLD